MLLDYIKEEDMPNVIMKHLNEIKPDILVITGHDAYYKEAIKKNYNHIKHE